MGCGLPVLVGDSGSLMEVAGSEQRLVRPHDPLALADKLEALAGDADLRRREGGRTAPARSSTMTSG